MPRDGQTGVVVLVPPADAVLTAVAQQYPEAVRDGIPAHVSLLYPFLHADELDENVLRALSELLAQSGPMTVTLDEVQRQDDFVALRPNPITGLRELSAAMQRRWPDVVPYDGRFGDVDPHVTVALHTTAERARAIAEQIVPPLLPIAAELRDVWLVAYSGGRWTVRQKFALGLG